jgi:HTH-type transcriptional regulator, transcriptional repressor of NAD biosynthesis genes
MNLPMTRGMVLGKFMPPHVGHLHLIEFARALVDELFVVVGTLAAEPIPGAVRHAWMAELVPGATVLHLDDELPQDPSEHPEFWALWQRSLARVLPARPDYVFASEAYGAPLAELFDATFVPVDLERGALPISASAIRAEPWTHWDRLPACVRPHFATRVAVFGPESTGKSTLAQALARRYATVAVPEYARVWLEQQRRPPIPADMPWIARAQIAAEDSLARACNRLLVCDTDPLATLIWAEVLFGAAPEPLPSLAAGRRYDLSLLLDVDVPWIADPVRYLPGQRTSFFDRCQAALAAAGRPTLVLRGDWDQRWASACAAVDALVLAAGGTPPAPQPCPPP